MKEGEGRNKWPGTYQRPYCVLKRFKFLSNTSQACRGKYLGSYSLTSLLRVFSVVANKKI